MNDITIDESLPQINIETATRTYHLPIASSDTLGGIKVGNNLTIEEDGTLNAEATEYTLPAATSSTLGGIKVGDALSINDQILSVDCDTTLSADSTRPVRNSVITSELGTLDSTLTTVSTTVTSLVNNVATLSNTVTGHTSSITALQDTVTALGGTVSANTENIAGNASTIADLTTTVDTISDNLTALSGTVTDQGNALSEVTSDVGMLKEQVHLTITNSYLLPINTWTDGSIQLEKRGKVATLTFNLQCTLTMHTADVQVHTLSTYTPSADTFGVLLTDAGTILCKVDTNGVITLMNPEGDNKTITKVLGQVTLVYQ